MPTAKITKSFVDQTPFAPKGKQVLYCDTELRGFYLIVGMQTKTYVVQKDVQGRTKRHTIGQHGHFTPEEARKLAKDKLYLMAQGIDLNKKAEDEANALVTLDKVLESYRLIRKDLKESTKEDYKYTINKYLSDWKDKLMTDINKDMIVARHHEITEKNGPQVANSAMRILRALFNHAHVTFDICEVNPVQYLTKARAWNKTKRRQTYIKPHQLKEWWKAVQKLDNDTMRDFLIFLLFTGLRRGEASRLRWKDIDFVEKTILLSDTKNGDPLTLPIGDTLFNMFKERKQKYAYSEYVFPGRGTDSHIIEPRKAIDAIYRSTQIEFTCHDLRRTFITIAEGLDIPYYALKNLVNHRVTDVTSGYIIRNTERLRAPVERIEKFILGEVK